MENQLFFADFLQWTINGVVCTLIFLLKTKNRRHLMAAEAARTMLIILLNNVVTIDRRLNCSWTLSPGVTWTRRGNAHHVLLIRRRGGGPFAGVTRAAALRRNRGFDWISLPVTTRTPSLWSWSDAKSRSTRRAFELLPVTCGGDMMNKTRFCRRKPWAAADGDEKAPA